MNITVLGLWHLGSVTAACCARHFQVVGLDFDEANIAKLNSGQAPLSEPGFNELIGAGIASKKLSFATDPKTACARADVLWLCYDTPVNDNDESDVNFVLANLRRALPHLPQGTLVLVSSQLPVGTCRKLEVEFPQFHFACSPENLRLGRAIDSFEKADRVVVGIRVGAVAGERCYCVCRNRSYCHVGEHRRVVRVGVASGCVNVVRGGVREADHHCWC